MKGARRQDKQPHELEAGEYCFDAGGDGRWYLCMPDGIQCAISPKIHSVMEHEDGSITVSPSIIRYKTTTSPEWHGFLERGVWRSA